MKKTLSLILALAMVVAMFAGIIPTANAKVTLPQSTTSTTGYVVLRPTQMGGKFPVSWVTAPNTAGYPPLSYGQTDYYFNTQDVILVPANNNSAVYHVTLDKKYVYGATVDMVLAIPEAAIINSVSPYQSCYIKSDVPATDGKLILPSVSQGVSLPVYNRSANVPFYAQVTTAATPAFYGEYALYAIKLADAGTFQSFVADYTAALGRVTNMITDVAADSNVFFNNATYNDTTKVFNHGGNAYELIKIGSDAYTFDPVTGQTKTFANVVLNSGDDTFKGAKGAGSFYAFVLVQSSAQGQITANFSTTDGTNAAIVAIRNDSAYSFEIPSTFELGPNSRFGGKLTKNEAFTAATKAVFTNVATGVSFEVAGQLSTDKKTASFAWSGVVTGTSGTTDVSDTLLIDRYLAPATYSVSIYDGTSVVATGVTTTSYAASAITIVPANPVAAVGTVNQFFGSGAAFENITIRSSLINTPVTVTVYDAKGEEFIAYQTTTAAYANYPINFQLQKYIQHYSTASLFADGFYKMVVTHTTADGTVLTSNAINFAVGSVATKWTAVTPSETTIEVPAGHLISLKDVLSFTVTPDSQNKAGYNTFYNEFIGATLITRLESKTPANVQLVGVNTSNVPTAAPGLIGIKGSSVLEFVGPTGSVVAKVTVVVKDASSYFTVDNTAIRLDGTAGVESSATIKTESEEGKVVVGKTFTSNDESIAKVDANGVVTPVAEGETTIVVTTAFPKTSTTVKVTVCPPVEYLLYLPEYEINMYVGQIKMSRAYVVPKGAYNRAVTYASDDESVAFVLPNGNVVGLKAGKAILTATAVATGETQTVSVNVI